MAYNIMLDPILLLRLGMLVLAKPLLLLTAIGAVIDGVVPWYWPRAKACVRFHLPPYQMRPRLGGAGALEQASAVAGGPRSPRRHSTLPAHLQRWGSIDNSVLQELPMSREADERVSSAQKLSPDVLHLIGSTRHA